MRMRRRSPQDKKRLSYLKDRRNAYGENDKSSRKNIPRSRALQHRANRHRGNQVLTAATGTPDLDRADATEQRLKGKRPVVWRKCPDTPLGEYVAWQRERRLANGDH